MKICVFFVDLMKHKIKRFHSQDVISVRQKDGSCTSFGWYVCIKEHLNSTRKYFTRVLSFESLFLFVFVLSLSFIRGCF